MDLINGDRVVHPTFGVGTIASIETHHFSGQAERLFYRVDFETSSRADCLKTTVWVPVENQRAKKLRPITPKTDLARYRKLLKSAPQELDGDFRKRLVELEDRLELGTFQGLCEVVRDLSARSHEKSLGNSESEILRQARASLNEEWAAAKGIGLEEAVHEIDGFLSPING